MSSSEVWTSIAAKRRDPTPEPVAITGAAWACLERSASSTIRNIARILRGEQFIDSIPGRFRRAMLDKHITRLVKSGQRRPRVRDHRMTSQT